MSDERREPRGAQADLEREIATTAAAAGAPP